MDVRQSFEWALTTLVLTLGVMFAAMVAVKVARQVLSRRHAEAVRELRPQVIEAIETGEPLPLERRRRSVAESIAVALLPKLRGEDRAALAALLDDVGVLARAREGLRSRSASRRLRSAQLLGAAGMRSVVDDLRPLLDDRDGEVRLAAVQALGRIGDAAAVPSLFRVLDAQRVSGHAVSMAVMRIGQAASEEIEQELQAGSVRGRVVAAELVGILGVYSARRALEQMLDDAHVVRVAAIRSLGRLGFPQSAVPLIERLDRDLDIESTDVITENVAIVIALQSIGDHDSVPALRRAHSGPYRVAVAAERALVALDVDVHEQPDRPTPSPAVAGIPDLLPVPPMVTPVDADVASAKPLATPTTGESPC